MAKNEVLDPSPGKDTRMPERQQGGGAGREELYRSYVSGKDRISPAQAAVGWTRGPSAYRELQPGASLKEKGLKRQIECCWEQLGQISLGS